MANEDFDQKIKQEVSEDLKLLKGNERIDDLQRNHYRIIQDPGRFCFGMDGVLLSGFAKAKEGARVLDLGTGTGIIPILMEAKTGAAHFTGLEIQPESADMAARSVRLNRQEKKIEIITGDIKEAVSLFGAASFDVKARRKFLSGTQTIPVGGYSGAAQAVSVGAKADAAGLSFCRQRA